MILLSLLFITSVYSACINLEGDLSSFISTFGLTEVVNGRLGQICAGSGVITLGRVDLATALNPATTTITAPAQYVEGSTIKSLVCAIPRDTFTALAKAALDKTAPIDYEKISLSCKTNAGAEVLKFENKKLTITTAALKDPEPTTIADATATPTATPAPFVCDDVAALLKDPIKLLLGATVCVPDVGTFILGKLDFSNAAAPQMTVGATGEFIPTGATSGFKVKCAVNTMLIQMLLPLARSLDFSMVDVEKLKNALDIRCADSANAHEIIINKNTISGIDGDKLAKIFKLANININTFGQVYHKLQDSTIEIGPFKLDMGKLTTPWGTFDSGDAVDFLSKNTAVTKNGDQVTAITTPLGTVMLLPNGDLVFVGTDGKKLTIGSSCTKATNVGGTVVATCKTGVINFAPGGLVLGENGLKTVDGQTRIAIGAFKVPVICSGDPACLTRVLNTAQAFLASRNCQIAQQNDMFQVSCSEPKKKDEAQLILDDVLLTVNQEELPRAAPAELATVPKVPTSSVASSFSLAVSFTVILLAITL